MVAVLVVTSVILFLTVEMLMRRRDAALGLATPSGAQVALDQTGGALADEPRLEVAEGQFLAPGHSSARLLPDGALALGNGPLPAHLLGTIDRVELPADGMVRAGETVAVLYGASRVLRVRAPFDGKIQAVNRSLENSPARLSSGKPEERWLVQLRPRDLQQALARMHFAGDARRWLQAELQRLRDMLATVQGSARGAVVLADGGLPQRGLARQLEARNWSLLEDRFFAVPADDQEANPG